MEEFSVNTIAFINDDDGDGHVDYISAERVEWTYDRQGGRIDQRVLDPDLKIPADLVIIAIGFEGRNWRRLRITISRLPSGTR